MHPGLSRGRHVQDLMPCHLAAKTGDLILDAQFAPLEFGNRTIGRGGTPEFVAEFLFQLSVLLLKRFKMRVYRHRQLLCKKGRTGDYHQHDWLLGKGSVPRFGILVEGEFLCLGNFQLMPVHDRCSGTNPPR